MWQAGRQRQRQAAVQERRPTSRAMSKFAAQHHPSHQHIHTTWLFSAQYCKNAFNAFPDWDKDNWSLLCCWWRVYDRSIYTSSAALSCLGQTLQFETKKGKPISTPFLWKPRCRAASVGERLSALLTVEQWINKRTELLSMTTLSRDKSSGNRMGSSSLPPTRQMNLPCKRCNNAPILEKHRILPTKSSLTMSNCHVEMRNWFFQVLQLKASKHLSSMIF